MVTKTLRNIILSAFGIFFVIILLRVTNGLEHIWKFIDRFGSYILLLALLVSIGIAAYFYFYKKTKQENQDQVKKSWEFICNWWDETMGMSEGLKLEDSFMKEGYYDSSQGQTERFFGWNVTKMSTSERIIFIVGTSPFRVVRFINRPNIGEQEDPFESFYSVPPKPVPGFNDFAMQKYAEMERRKKETPEENDDAVDPLSGDWVDGGDL